MSNDLKELFHLCISPFMHQPQRDALVEDIISVIQELPTIMQRYAKHQRIVIILSGYNPPAFQWLIYRTAAVPKRTLSLASGGFIAPPGGNLTIDRVRLSVVISLLNGFMVSALPFDFIYVLLAERNHLLIYCLLTMFPTLSFTGWK